MKKLVCLVGPTASGKTGVAVELSKIIPIEVISCDSMQVYKGMPILTQAPSKEECGQVKMHLTSFVSPSREYNAAMFRKDAMELIPAILKKKKTPVIVGGTGLYLRALLDGLFEAPQGEISKDEDFRNQLLADQAKNGGNYLHEKLVQVDAASAKKIHPNDIRRIVRALEVYHLSGKPMSDQKTNRAGIRDQYDVQIFLLSRDRAELYDRINHRVDRMLKEGLLDEVLQLQKKKLSMTAGMALGFREMSLYLDGTMELKPAVELLKKNTRNYAKRQLSWFRHEKGVKSIVIDFQDTAQVIVQKILRG